jgi:Domain of unknown function (DUF4365)
VKLVGNESSILGDFGEGWLRVCAAGFGLLHGTPDSGDLIKSDVSVTHDGEAWGTSNPSVWVQVKTTQNARENDDGGLTYDLDVATYDVLRRTNSHTRRLLMVVKVSDPSKKVVVTSDGTLLVGIARWVSLEGWPETQNKDTVAVQLPGENTVDGQGLQRMLRQYGTRQSTPVPEVVGWKWSSGEQTDTIS